MYIIHFINKKVEISHKYRKFQQFIQKFNCSYTFFTKLRLECDFSHLIFSLCIIIIQKNNKTQKFLHRNAKTLYFSCFFAFIVSSRKKGEFRILCLVFWENFYFCHQLTEFMSEIHKTEQKSTLIINQQLGANFL